MKSPTGLVLSDVVRADIALVMGGVLGIHTTTRLLEACRRSSKNRTSIKAVLSDRKELLANRDLLCVAILAMKLLEPPDDLDSSSRPLAIGLGFQAFPDQASDGKSDWTWLAADRPLDK